MVKQVHIQCKKSYHYNIFASIQLTLCVCLTHFIVMNFKRFSMKFYISNCIQSIWEKT